MEFNEEQLPVKYLGLPITARLLASDCNTRVDKTIARSRSWAANLSFAGRLQLILNQFSLVFRFCSTFLVPVSIIKKRERVLKNFLWGGLREDTKIGKIKWEQVCKPLKEGGLGIRSLRIWNRALLLKQVWELLLDSWAWRQILKLRNIALDNIIYEVGRGDKFYLWHDPWFFDTSMHALYGHNVIRNASMRGNELIEVMVSEGQCKWPSIFVR
ncbi:LOW QUALITY PROTEIN: hypothetical protein CFOL_v3_23776 [Cephalotus follicularis]|uniref:Zf-RVT domain-containing protein n=1 Tax=Cephalotus follicularis TaxID=3775 RepID=A0A1Q3CJC9_CEPFO|nr:LOW QUALITY PROTEIN: hypothetical protein CFOL_v3_23776 [Cephalotus follicularis]